MKTYEAVFNEFETDGVFGISLVESPAMEGLFVALSKEEIKLSTVNEEQRILIGLVLEPNKPVYRNQGGEEFNLVFTEDTIKNLSYHFFKSNFHKNSTIEHDPSKKIQGVTFVESWIVADTEKDKSAVYGLKYPKGSWLATMKVDSDEVWENYIKTGKVQGFSVDAMLKLKEINLKSDNMPKDNQNILAALKNAFKTLLADDVKEVETVVEVVKMGMVKSADGQITFEYEGEELAAGVPFYAVSADGQKIPAPAGEYPLEDGKVVVVSEDGMISEVKEAMVEEEPAPAPMSEPTQQAPTFSQEDVDKIKSILIKYSEMENKLSELEKKNTELNAKVVELSNQPAAKPTRVVEPVKLTKQGRILNQIRNN